jgi:nitrate reductase NapE
VANKKSGVLNTNQSALEPPAASRRREVLYFLFLAVVIWPFIAVGVVGGWGLIVWIYQIIVGPPGPV